MTDTPSLLRAMARNYALGHQWDALDGKAVVEAADELDRLRAALARAERQNAIGNSACKIVSEIVTLFPLNETLAVSGSAQDLVNAVKAKFAELTQTQAKAEKLAEALVRLRDCDWVISLPDRMDAVRDIARQALTEWSAK